jgi:hypothetical protein
MRLGPHRSGVGWRRLGRGCRRRRHGDAESLVVERFFEARDEVGLQALRRQPSPLKIKTRLKKNASTVVLRCLGDAA